MMIPRATLPQQSRDMCPEERLRAVNIRPTIARLSVLQAIDAMPGPISAHDVFMALLAKGESLNLATVYRVLKNFEAVGLLMRERVPGLTSAKVVYSFIYPRADHTDTLRTHRLLCGSCGHSFTFHDAALLEYLRFFSGETDMHQLQSYLTITLDTCSKCR